MVKSYVCQADILDIDKTLQKSQLYGESESEVARFCLSVILVGKKKRTVNMLSQPIRQVNFKRYWNNLQKNAYFNVNSKSINIEELQTDIPFLLMMKCAEGKLERKKKEA